MFFKSLSSAAGRVQSNERFAQFNQAGENSGGVNRRTGSCLLTLGRGFVFPSSISPAESQRTTLSPATGSAAVWVARGVGLDRCQVLPAFGGADVLPLAAKAGRVGRPGQFRQLT
jgi:hypothetical protein